MAGSGQCEASSCEDGWTGIDCDQCLASRYGEGCAPCSCATGVDCHDGRAGDGSCYPPRNCTALSIAGQSAGDGVYTIDPDGAGALPEMAAYCDMTTDLGGWTLVLDYLHQGGTNPPLVVRTTDLPLLGSDLLGVDESASVTWGHASNALFAALSATQVHFYAKTSAHGRIIDFKTSNAPCISMFGGGSGTCIDLGTDFEPYADHNAFLPAAQDLAWSGQGDYAMTAFPFYRGGTYHWGIRGENDLRWEVDDYHNSAAYDTLHRIFVRGDLGDQCAPNPCQNGGDCSDGNNAFTCACQGSFTGDRCEDCVRGAYGPQCLACACAPGIHCNDGTAGDGSCYPPHSCAAVLAAGLSTGDDVYQIDPDGPGALPLMAAYCDMTTDGGGWTLVLNYLHLGGTNPGLLVRAGDLPMRGSDLLGSDESGSGTWGHAGNALFAALAPGEVRFYGVTDQHNRVIHFKSADSVCIAAFGGGTGDCIGLGGNFVALDGHSAYLPLATNFAYAGQGDLALTNFPFYRGGTYHWGIRGIGERWEVDDYTGDARANTLHRVFVR